MGNKGPNLFVPIQVYYTNKCFSRLHFFFFFSFWKHQSSSQSVILSYSVPFWGFVESTLNVVSDKSQEQELEVCFIHTPRYPI